MPGQVALSIKALLEGISAWAAEEDGILAILLVGSHARGQARPDSDIDLVLVCKDQQHYLENTAWVRAIGEPLAIAKEDWGKVISVRACYQSGAEVEFGFTDSSWLERPLDAGTRRVLLDGYRVLIDRSGITTDLPEELMDE